MAAYDDSNRAFLQAFLARSVLTLETAKPLLAAIFSVHEGREARPDDVTIEDLDSYISAANSRLVPLDLEIRSVFHQQSKERWYAIVNTTSDSLTQLATTYSAEEISYVKRLLDAMFDGVNNRGKREAMCLSTMEALQLNKPNRRTSTQQGSTSQSANQGLTVAGAEAMLAKLVDDGWLEKSQKGFYSLTPRALMELKGWLVDTYNEADEEEDGGGGASSDKIKFCHACKEIITVGQRCPRRECPCRLHDICTQSFFRMHRSKNCPICKTAWGGQDFVGEKAITTSEAYLKGRRKSTNQPRARIEETNGHDDNEDEG